MEEEKEEDGKDGQDATCAGFGGNPDSKLHVEVFATCMYILVYCSIVCVHPWVFLMGEVSPVCQ